MHELAKYAIIANVILSLLFIAFNFIYAKQTTGVHQALWSPLWLFFYNAQYAQQIGPDIGITEPNFSFYFFWAAIAINLYFILKLSAEAKKQN